MNADKIRLVLRRSQAQTARERMRLARAREALLQHDHELQRLLDLQSDYLQQITGWKEGTVAGLQSRYQMAARLIPMVVRMRELSGQLQRGVDRARQDALRAMMAEDGLVKLLDQSVGQELQYRARKERRSGS